MQSILGIINNISQMATFFRGFKFNLNAQLKMLIENDCNLKFTEFARQELSVFPNFLLQKNVWHPIVPKYHYPPLSAFEIVTDASGKYMEAGTGCGHIILNFDLEIVFAYQFLWPESNFLLMKDSKGSLFSNKTFCLEFVGIVIPFLLKPEILKNK
jgi:hypothetical protein